MSRYVVGQLPDQSRWVILDRHMWGYCSLPTMDEDGNTVLLPLEWRSKEAAEAWLNRCYLIWQRGTVPAPRQWQPLPPMMSPWAVVPTTPPLLPGAALPDGPALMPGEAL